LSTGTYHLTKSNLKRRIEMSGWLCSTCDNINRTGWGVLDQCPICGKKKGQLVTDSHKAEEETDPLEKRVFGSGATRSMDVEEFRFDLAPACATRREAKIWKEGADIHGDNNWKKGFPIHVCLNHIEHHLNKYKDGDRAEDHLAKIAVNSAMAMIF